jgi:hypothetical protein
MKRKRKEERKSRLLLFNNHLPSNLRWTLLNQNPEVLHPDPPNPDMPSRQSSPTQGL